MKVICIMYEGTVEDVIVCNDEDEQRLIDKLADANDKRPKDERINIHSLTPSSADAVLDYVATR
jgi:hypothetical protein